MGISAGFDEFLGCFFFVLISGIFFWWQNFAILKKLFLKKNILTIIPFF